MSTIHPFSGLAVAARLGASVWNHPANRHRRIRSLGRFLAWQFTKHIFKRPIVIRFHNRRLKCYPDSTSTSAALYFAGYPDYWEMKFLKEYLRPGDNFLDIGANSGVYSIFAASCIGIDGCIDAFEPVERTAARIEEQAALNGLANLRVHRCAVADRDGQMEFGFSGNDATMHARRLSDDPREGQTVTCVKLDTFVPYAQYAAGKMDIEGAEPFALAGASNRLHQANPPVWLLELNGFSRYYGVSSDEVVERLAQAGFDCAVFDPQSRKLEYNSTPWMLGVQNVLAIARKHRSQVESRLESKGAPLQ